MHRLWLHRDDEDSLLSYFSAATLEPALSCTNCNKILCTLDHSCNKMTFVVIFHHNCVCKGFNPRICTIHRDLANFKCRSATDGITARLLPVESKPQVWIEIGFDHRIENLFYSII